MFRFWASDPRGSDETLATPQPIVDLVKPHHPSILPDAATIATSNLQSPKRRRQSFDDDADVSPASAASAKRVKTGAEPSDDVLVSNDATAHSTPDASGLDRARDEIRHQFGLEILLKHDELRLINQELAKCQVALEQLRRCHLIPYPVSCPTPEQMLEISAGKGPALQSHPGEHPPRWAPPFGVADGPYARHYAKWLIPDPAFDGVQPEWQFTPEATRSRSSFTEGRTTRNSLTDFNVPPKGRSVRGAAGQKLQSLSNGYPQPKDKAGPCVLKRADGQTVKLVCIDCNRENFSSTQGFINHCRIAHKRDYKSHEEAAVHSGHPIEVAESGGIAGEEKSAPPGAPAPPTSTSVHPFARPEMTDQQAYTALKSRIADSLKLYRQGKLPGVTSIPSGPSVPKSPAQSGTPRGLVATPEVPHLSRLLQSRQFSGNLRDLVMDAKTKIDLDDMTPGDESEAGDSSSPAEDAPAVRTPVIMRVPTRATQPTEPTTSTSRPTGNKGRSPAISFTAPPNPGMGVRTSTHGSNAALSEEDLDMEDADLSPNTLISNNAPSLVSDDGEYDDSDDGSSVSGTSDNLGAESVSDVAEITIDDEPDSRSLRRGSSGVSGTVRLKKDDPKHVTFMTPVKSSAEDRRPRNV